MTRFKSARPQKKRPDLSKLAEFLLTGKPVVGNGTTTDPFKQPYRCVACGRAIYFEGGHFENSPLKYCLRCKPPEEAA